MQRARPVGAALALLVFGLAGCGDTSTGDRDVGIPNPASEHCVEEGGRLDIRQDDRDGQVGICVFEDGSQCEEWAFYRGECAPGGG
jgi:putative hemolysin